MHRCTHLAANSRYSAGEAIEPFTVAFLRIFRALSASLTPQTPRLLNGSRRGQKAGGTAIDVERTIPRFFNPRNPVRSNSTGRARRQVMQHAVLDEDDGEIGEAADQGEHQDRDEHHRGIGLALAEREQVAEAEIAA